MVIGYGNSLRRDDGAGLLLAARLAAALEAKNQSVACRCYHQLTMDIAAEIDSVAPARLIFVDAAVEIPVRTGIEVTLLSGGGAGLAGGLHHSSPALLLTALDRLYHRRPITWLVTVPAVDLAHGEGLSPEVRGLLDAPDLIRNLLSRLR